MTRGQARNDDLRVLLRWSGRVVGLMATALFVLLVIDWGPSVFLTLPWSRPTGMPLFIALALSIAGVVIAWRWETTGGVLALAGSLAIILLVYLGSGTARMLVAFVMTMPLLVAGILYLACSGCAVASSRLSARPGR